MRSREVGTGDTTSVIPNGHQEADVSKVFASIATSVDGYITGPDDGPGKGLGEAGSGCTTGFSAVRGPTTRSQAVSRDQSSRSGSTLSSVAWGLRSPAGTCTR